MEVAEPAAKRRDIIKVKFMNQSQHKTKILSSRDLNYAKLVGKLSSMFELTPHTYYHLYYSDQDAEPITLELEQDYAIFIHSPQPLQLYLQQTPEHHLDFRKYTPS